jgi:hypothetical protein
MQEKSVDWWGAFDIGRLCVSMEKGDSPLKAKVTSENHEMLQSLADQNGYSCKIARRPVGRFHEVVLRRKHFMIFDAGIV